MEIAKEILRQLGGNKFVVMTGAKYFTADKNALCFAFMRSNGVNRVKITLNAMDTYDLEFGYVRGANMTVVKTCEGVYNDGLVETFERVTGLATRLF